MSKTVLVTGISGFIGLYCAKELLENGYKVIGTVRNSAKREEVINTFKKNDINLKNLTFEILELTSNNGWDKAIQDCEYVMHVASPFRIANPKNENDMISPAVEGTSRVLEASQKGGVKRIVLTSSILSMMSSLRRGQFGPKDWTDINYPNLSTYIKSKTLAERVAWDFMNDLTDDEKFDFTVINPVGVFGPMLTRDIGTSNSLVQRLISGDMPACPATHLGYVDVRDVAKAHIFSMLNSSTNDKRIIVSESEMFFVDVGRILNEAGFKKSPTKQMPNWLVKIFALFIKDLSGVTKSLGKRVDTDKSLAKSLFDWEYISAKDSVLDTANQLSSFNTK